MSRGKYLSLEEVRQKNKQGKDKIERFCKEHPSKGSKQAFEGILDAMAKNEPLSEETSVQGHDED